MTHKFAVGDKVIFTNEFGVCWGVKTIKSLEPGLSENDGPRYHIEPTDTPWFSTSEKNLSLADHLDVKIAHNTGGLPFTAEEYFQNKYGRPTTQEELDSLLDGDPFEGER